MKCNDPPQSRKHSRTPLTAKKVSAHSKAEPRLRVNLKRCPRLITKVDKIISSVRA